MFFMKKSSRELWECSPGARSAKNVSRFLAESRALKGRRTKFVKRWEGTRRELHDSRVTAGKTAKVNEGDGVKAKEPEKTAEGTVPEALADDIGLPEVSRVLADRFMDPRLEGSSDLARAHEKALADDLAAALERSKVRKEKRRKEPVKKSVVLGTWDDGEEVSEAPPILKTTRKKRPTMRVREAESEDETQVTRSDALRPGFSARGY